LGSNGIPPWAKSFVSVLSDNHSRTAIHSPLALYQRSLPESFLHLPLASPTCIVHLHRPLASPVKAHLCFLRHGEYTRLRPLHPLRKPLPFVLCAVFVLTASKASYPTLRARFYPSSSQRVRASTSRQVCVPFRHLNPNARRERHPFVQRVIGDPGFPLICVEVSIYEGPHNEIQTSFVVFFRAHQNRPPSQCLTNLLLINRLASQTTLSSNVVVMRRGLKGGFVHFRERDNYLSDWMMAR
jgi:hypothetical protein